jgi:hypothetical protein
VIIKRGDPGIEPGTSCTLNRNHTTRPIARLSTLAPPFLNSTFALPSTPSFPPSLYNDTHNSSEDQVRRSGVVAAYLLEGVDAGAADRAGVGAALDVVGAGEAEAEVVAGFDQRVHLL